MSGAATSSPVLSGIIHLTNQTPTYRSEIDLLHDDEGLYTRVYRWRDAVCMMSLGMFKAVAEMRCQLDRDVENLFLSGDYMRVPSVSGIGAAEQVVELLASRPV